MTLAAVPWLWPISDGNAKGSFGGIEFYGPKGFVRDCLKALNEDLAQYDCTLKREFLEGKIKLCFYYGENKSYLSFPTVGLYTIPDKICHYGSEGICQFVVFRYFQSSEIGLGLAVALKGNPWTHKSRLDLATPKMIAWLQKTNYPKRWLGWYK